MRYIAIIIALFVLAKVFGEAIMGIMRPLAGVFIVLFLIRLALRGTSGKTKNGRTGTYYDDYL